MNVYRFRILAVGFGEHPSEAFQYVLNNLPSAPEVTLDQEIGYDQICEGDDLRETLCKMLALHERAVPDRAESSGAT